MNPRTVVSLAVGLAFLVAIILLSSSQKDGPNQRGELLFPQLRDDINAVESVTITAPEAVVANLTPVDNSWELAERNGYPGNAGQLRQLLLALADARLIEAKTANPEYYHRLGVEDIATENAGGILVQVQTANSDYAVIIGNQVQGEYAYVRRPDEAGSWLIDRSPEAPRRTQGWLDRSLTDVDANLVHSVQILHPDGETIGLTKSDPEASTFTVLEVPAGRELQHAGVANAIGGVLDNLTLDDVAANDEADQTSVQILFKTFDGRIIEIHATQSDEEPWIRIAARYDPALAARFAPDPEASASDNGPPTPLLPTDALSAAAVEDLVATLNKRVAGNRYQIPQFKYEQLTRRWDDLLKPAP